MPVCFCACSAFCLFVFLCVLNMPWRCNDDDWLIDWLLAMDSGAWSEFMAMAHKVMYTLVPDPSSYILPHKVICTHLSSWHYILPHKVMYTCTCTWSEFMTLYSATQSNVHTCTWSKFVTMAHKVVYTHIPDPSSWHYILPHKVRYIVSPVQIMTDKVSFWLKLISNTCPSAGDS